MLTATGGDFLVIPKFLENSFRFTKFTTYLCLWNR